jgi:hypothetical protein
MNSYESPSSRHVLSLQNWLRGNACIARNETAFLEREDLLALSCAEDRAVSWIGETIHDSFVRLGNVRNTLSEESLPLCVKIKSRE